MRSKQLSRAEDQGLKGRVGCLSSVYSFTLLEWLWPAGQTKRLLCYTNMGIFPKCQPNAVIKDLKIGLLFLKGF